MKSHKTILASILTATLYAASPLLASATDHGSSGSSSSDSRPAPAPAPVERSAPAPAPVERSAPAPAPVERSAPAPVERSAPAPVANAPLQGGGTQPLPRSPVRGPVQPLPRYTARTPVRPIRNEIRISGSGTTTSRGSAPPRTGAMAFGGNSKRDSRQARTSLRGARRGHSFCKSTV